MDSLELSLLFLSALISGFFLTPLFGKVAKKFGLMDYPGHRKTHAKPVAYLGGVAVFAALSLTLGFFWLLSFRSFNISQENEKIFLIFVASFGVFVVGLWDDISHIRPRDKVLGQLIFAGLFSAFGYRFETFQVPGFQPVDLGVVSIPFTVFWILSVINAFNMIDGLDGLASTVTAGSLFLLGAASAMIGNSGILILSLAAMGSVLGFLRYNWSPASIYLGDAGSNGLGMLLAASLVALGQNNCWFPGSPTLTKELGQPFPYQVFVVTLLVSYPVLEILLSVFRRLLKGRPISRGDKGHIHHRLLNLGWAKQGACLAALGVTFLMGSVPIALLAHQYGKATWLLAVSSLLLGLVLSFLGFLNFLLPHVVARNRPHFLIANSFIAMQRGKLGLAGSREDVLALLSQTCAEFGVQGFKINVNSNGHGNSPCRYSWERSHEMSREYLNYLKTDIVKGNFEHFKEQLSLEGGNCDAFWIFEPHTEERDLDVEYRVLVSEFMKEAMDRLYVLKGNKSDNPVVQLNGLAHGKVRSSLLSRRHVKKN